MTARRARTTRPRAGRPAAIALLVPSAAVVTPCCTGVFPAITPIMPVNEITVDE